MASRLHPRKQKFRVYSTHSVSLTFPPLTLVFSSMHAMPKISFQDAILSAVAVGLVLCDDSLASLC
jgi:hypothetical protein